MGEKTRQIRLTMDLPERLPVRILQEKLSALQKIVWDVARSQMRHDPATERLSRKDLNEYALLLRKISFHSPMNIVAEIQPDETHPAVMAKGEVVLEGCGLLFEGLCEEDREKIDRALPDKRYRERAIKAAGKIIPDPKLPYHTTIQVGSMEQPMVLKRPREEYLNSLISSKKEEAKELKEEVTIQAKCRAKLLGGGLLAEVVEVLDYKIIDSEDLWPYCPREIRWGTRLFLLNQPLTCIVEIEGGLHTITYDPLKIHVYAASQEQAINEFGEEFAILYDEYYSVDDEQLTKDAIRLKVHLREIIQRVE